MPYIRQVDRPNLEEGMTTPDTAGELNFVLTTLVLRYLGKKPNYQSYNDVLGALEGCKLELYRRAVAPYEDTKIEENGDVY